MTETEQEEDVALVQELLSFRVGEQEYSVDIMSVREIRGWTRATPLPHSAPYIRGVINLRGAVLPIIDLGCRLEIPVDEATKRNVIIVVQMEKHTVGLLVDAVSDILAVPQSELQPPPELESDSGQSCVKALTIVDGRMLRVLDLSSIMPRSAGNEAA